MIIFNDTVLTKFMWLYAVMPYLGAILAGLMFISHNSQDANDRKRKGLPPTALQKRRENYR